MLLKEPPDNMIAAQEHFGLDWLINNSCKRNSSATSRNSRAGGFVVSFDGVAAGFLPLSCDRMLQQFLTETVGVFQLVYGLAKNQ